MKEVSMPEPVQYRNKETQSDTGMLWYRNRTEMMNAGMPIPGYARYWVNRKNIIGCPALGYSL
jgi:hypothetical protein